MMVNFVQLVEQTLTESPDNVNYNGQWYSFDDGDLTFFIAEVVARTDVKKGYRSDTPTNLGICIVGCPTSIPLDKESEIYLEDPSNNAMTHWNLYSLLNYNKVYNYDKLKSFGIEIFSFKTDADIYFQNMKEKFPRIAFAFKNEEKEIGLKFRGRIWQSDDKILVSTWHFDKDIMEKYIIPFIKNRYKVTENKIIIDVSIEDHTEKIISAKNLTKTNNTLTSVEKEIVELKQKLHQSTGSKKERIKLELKSLLIKHGIDLKKHGLEGESKPSELYANKILGNSKETFASIKANQQTSESFINI